MYIYIYIFIYIYIYIHKYIYTHTYKGAGPLWAPKLRALTICLAASLSAIESPMERRLCLGFHGSHKSLGKGSQGNSIRPIRDHQGLLGLLRPYWEDLAPLV